MCAMMYPHVSHHHHPAPVYHPQHHDVEVAHFAHHHMHGAPPGLPPGMLRLRTGKRTRRGGRGRNRRRGRKVLPGGAHVPMGHHLGHQYHRATTSQHQQQQQQPWWYSHMARSGLTPAGLAPSPEEGFPVILPTSQAVYILPTAKNPHRASTYYPSTCCTTTTRRTTTTSGDDDTETPLLHQKQHHNFVGLPCSSGAPRVTFDDDEYVPDDDDDDAASLCPASSSAVAFALDDDDDEDDDDFAGEDDTLDGDCCEEDDDDDDDDSSEGPIPGRCSDTESVASSSAASRFNFEDCGASVSSTTSSRWFAAPLPKAADGGWRTAFDQSRTCITPTALKNCAVHHCSAMEDESEPVAVVSPVAKLTTAASKPTKPTWRSLFDDHAPPNNDNNNAVVVKRG